jgi:ribosomal protein S18 acetylase RimI-like enzyme
VIRRADVTSLSVQPARPEDYERIAQLTVDVYVGGGLASAGYAAELADVAGRAERSQLLVVREESGRIVGSVALVLEGDFGEVTESEEDAGVRMLVVDPAVQGRGIGTLLMTECMDRARAAGKRRMVLSTGSLMTAAHRLYERLGFSRLPGRDWTPVPGIHLRVYALALEAPSAVGDGRDEVPLLQHLALDHVHLPHDAGPLGQDGDLHLHGLEDDQRVPGSHRGTGLHEDLPDAGDHLREDLLDRHRTSS